MPSYDRGMMPQSVQDLLLFLREELQRIEAYANNPRAAGEWEDLRFPATSLGAGATAPGWNSTDIGLSFGTVATNSVQAIAQMPHSWKEGSNIRPHIHWEPGAGFTGGTAAVWVLAYRWRNNGETAGAMTSSTITVTPSASGTLALMVSAFPEITATGKNISSIIEFQLSRTPTAVGDSMTAAAILKEFDVHYLTDSFGSGKEYKK